MNLSKLSIVGVRKVQQLRISHERVLVDTDVVVISAER